MQLFANLKKILRREFRATLNFQKFKVALNPLCRNLLLNFTKSCIFHANYNSIIKNGVTKLVFELKALKAKIGQFFDTMIVASIDKEW